MTSYLPPSGYRLPNQAYSRYSYDGNLYVPAKVGPLGGVLPSGTSVSPLTIIKTVPITGWWRADTVTLNSGFVSSFIDKSGNSNHLIQATAGKQPAYNPADATLNNQPTITGDGADDFLNCVGITVGVQYWMTWVAKTIVWSATGQMLVSSPNGGAANVIRTQVASPNYILFNTSAFTAQNSGAPVGQWKQFVAQETNQITDFLQIGSVVSTGTALLRTATSNNLTIFAASSGGAALNAAIAEGIVTTGVPSAGEKSAIAQYLASRYISSILT